MMAGIVEEDRAVIHLKQIFFQCQWAVGEDPVNRQPLSFIKQGAVDYEKFLFIVFRKVRGTGKGFRG